MKFEDGPISANGGPGDPELELRGFMERLADLVCRVILAKHDDGRAFADAFLAIIQAGVTEDHEGGAESLGALVALIDGRRDSLGAHLLVDQVRELAHSLGPRLPEIFAAIRALGAEAAMSGWRRSDADHPAFLLVLSALMLFTEDRLACNRGLDFLSAAVKNYPEDATAVAIELYTSLALVRCDFTSLDELNTDMTSPESPLILVAVEAAFLAEHLDYPAEELAWTAGHILRQDHNQLRAEVADDDGLRFAVVVAGVAGTARLIRQLAATGETGLAFSIALPMAVGRRHKTGTLQFA